MNENAKEMYVKLLLDSEKFPLDMAVNLGRLATAIFEEDTLEENTIIGEELLKAINSFPPIRKVIFKKLFGLDEDYKLHSVEELTSEFNLTSEMIEEIAIKVHGKLMHPLISRKYYTVQKERYEELKARYETTEKLQPSSSIAQLDLSIRAYNALMRHGVTTVEDFLNLTSKDLLTVKNLGRTSLFEITYKREVMNKPLK